MVDSISVADSPAPRLLRELFESARQVLTLEDVALFAPEDPGYHNYVETWWTVVRDGVIPLSRSFEVKEVIGLTVDWDPPNCDLERFRPFRQLLVATAWIALWSDELNELHSPRLLLVLVRVARENQIEGSLLSELIADLERAIDWSWAGPQEQVYFPLALILLESLAGTSPEKLETLATRVDQLDLAARAKSFYLDREPVFGLAKTHGPVAYDDHGWREWIDSDWPRDTGKPTLELLAHSWSLSSGAAPAIANRPPADPRADVVVPPLVADRIRLIPLSSEHSSGMFSLWSDSAVCEFSGRCEDADGREIAVPTPTLTESNRLLDFWLRRAEAGDGFRWAVTLLDDERFVGAVGFNTLGRCPEYAYHFLSSSWGIGLATEASTLALQWAFDHGADEVEAWIEIANVRSIRLATRLGFVSAAPAREADTQPNPGAPQRYVLSRSSHRASRANSRG